MGCARRGRPQLAKRLSDPGPCACVWILLPDPAVGRMADVRSSHTDTGRFDQLYRRADHFMGHFTGSVSHNFRAPLCPTDIQEPVSNFPDAQAQTVTRSCGGKCTPHSNRNPISSLVSKDWMPSTYIPRGKGSSNRTKTGARSTRGAVSLRPAPRSECWAHGHVRRHCRHCAGRQFVSYCKFASIFRPWNARKRCDIGAIGPLAVFNLRAASFQSCRKRSGPISPFYKWCHVNAVDLARQQPPTAIPSSTPGPISSPSLPDMIRTKETLT
jgi:hypothetical protein